MADEELKETKGLFAQMMSPSEPIKTIAGLTLQDFEDLCMSEMSKIQEPPMLHVGAGFLLSMPDEIFTAMWDSPSITCYCSLESEKEILKRAEKLNLIKK